MTKQEELYASIVEDMKGLYNGKLSDVEAHEAARNFIEFVKIMLKVARRN